MEVVVVVVGVAFSYTCADRQTDRQTHRQTDRQTDRQTRLFFVLSH